MNNKNIFVILLMISTIAKSNTYITERALNNETTLSDKKESRNTIRKRLPTPEIPHKSGSQALQITDKSQQEEIYEERRGEKNQEEYSE